MANKRAEAQKRRRAAEKKCREEEEDAPRPNTTDGYVDIEPTWILLDPDEADDDIFPRPTELINFINGNVVDSSDEDDCADHLEQALFPVFTCPSQPDKLLGKRKNKRTGLLNHYKHPIENPNKLSKKLVPRKLPKYTRHNYKKKRENALGKNNAIMESWLEVSKPQAQPSASQESLEDLRSNHANDQLQNLSLDFDEELEDAQSITRRSPGVSPEDGSSPEESVCGDQESTTSRETDEYQLTEYPLEYTDMIEARVDAYRSSQPIGINSPDRSIAINEEWSRLNSVIKEATEKYNSKCQECQDFVPFTHPR